MPEASIRLGDIVPNFQANTTKGDFHFHDFFDGSSWVIFLSHPADFTPVCTTELGAVAKLAPEFEKRGVKVIGLSCDDLKSHQAWIGDINKTQGCSVQFPIVADPDRQVATLFGMLDHQDPTNVDKKGLPLTVRSVFVIDPSKKVRLMLTYPATTGRNFDEILRVVDSLQLTDSKKVTTPADWKRGEKVIVHPGVSDEKARELFGEFETVKPYLRFTKV